MTSIFEVKNTGGSVFGGKAAGANKPAGKADAQKPSFDDLLAEFQNAASETPAERAASAVLKKHGVTKEQLAKLPRAERDAILKEVEEAVKKVTRLEAQKTLRPNGST